MKETKSGWNYFHTLLLVFCLLGMCFFFYGLRHGLIIEPYGYMRLHELDVQKYVSEMSNWSEQDLKVELQEIIQNNSHTLSYGENSHIRIDYKSSYFAKGAVLQFQSTIKTQLNQLDKLVYATSLSNSARGKEEWTIYVFCKEQKKCIERLWTRNQAKQLEQKNQGYLFPVKNKHKAERAMALLHHLIGFNEGMSILDDSKSIYYLLKQYK